MRTALARPKPTDAARESAALRAVPFAQTSIESTDATRLARAPKESPREASSALVLPVDESVEVATVSATREGGRVLGLDAARALAVLAMIFGHTMDAVLSAEARLVPWVATYWNVRNFTAPLFLFVSGWVVVFVLTRSGLKGPAVIRRFLPRIALLFALGYLVRFPIWNLKGLWRLDAKLWHYFLTFDALQCIAMSMLITLCVCAVAFEKKTRALLLSTLAVAIVLFTPWVWSTLGAADIGSFFKQTFGGGDSRFAVFPWSAYFVCGGVLGMLFTRLRSRTWRFVSMIALGVALYAYARLGADSSSLGALHNTDAHKIIWRLGVVVWVVAFALVLPSPIARSLAPIGRASLWAYVIHLPIAYGWGYWPGLSTRVGQTLSATHACLLAIGVVIFSAGAALLAKRLVAALKRPRAWGAGEVATVK